MNLHKGITTGLTIRQTLVKVYRAYEKKGAYEGQRKEKGKEANETQNEGNRVGIHKTS